MPEQTIHDKVVTIVSALKTAVDGKANTSHTHSASDIVSGLAPVATSGDYDDLSNKPTIPAAQVQSDWSQADSASVDYIKNKPTNVSSFTNDAGYLTSHQELRYAIVTPTVTVSTTDSSDDTISAVLQDRAVNVVEAGSGVDYVNLTFPASEQGYVRDFFVRLVLTGDSVPAVSFSEHGGGDVEFDVDDDSWAEIELGVNLLMFTETSQDSGSNS